MLKKRYQLLLVTFFVLIVYYPAAFGGYSRIDDNRLIEGYQSPDVTLNSIFKMSAGVAYYRPITMATYWLEKRLFNLDPGMMHLDNILFHLINTILVFFLTRLVLPRNDRDRSYLPLVAASLFGLHPLNSESINWISGRTDPLAAIFILTSALFLLKFRDSLEKKHLAISITAFLLGVLTKEVAYAFLPGALLILNADDPGHADTARKLRSQYVNRIILAITASAVLFLMMKYYTATSISISGQLMLTLRIIFSDPFHAMFVVLRAFAFYFKKLIIPYPLNAFIMELDPLYQIVAAPLLLLCIYIATRRTLVSAIFITGIFLIAPSFIIAFKSVAWSPYAERYLYLPSAFFVVSASVYLNEKLKHVDIKLKRTVLVAVMLIMAVMTMQRAYIWQNDSTLVADTIEKSPLSKEFRILYGSLLIEKGDYEKAVQQFTVARSLYSFTYDARPDLFTAYIRYKQGKYDEALKIDEEMVDRTGGKSVDALNSAIGTLWAKLQLAKTEKEKYLLYRRLLKYNQMVFRLSNDPFVLYRLGDLSLKMENRTEAAKYFQQASSGMADDEPFKIIARGKAEKLSGDRQ